MLNPYLKLALVSVLPVLLSVVFYLFEKKEFFRSLPEWSRQLIIGLSFGCLAILGNEFGIPLSGAQVNCRDGAVLCAGLLFGGPAGIIAGIVGGLERWLCVYWGGGTFTRLACSFSTLFAGFYAAALNRHMFEGKKPVWSLAGMIGLVMEVFHLTMVFVTNLNQADRAAEVVKACTLPMLLANSLCVLFATAVLSLLSGDVHVGKKSNPGISQTIQRRLLLCVVFTFLLTSVFVLGLQNNMAAGQTQSLLSLSLEDVRDAVIDASDRNLLEVTRKVAVQAETEELDYIARISGIAEINEIDADGYIVRSTNPDFIGYSMASGEQSAAFLPLLDGSLSELVQDYGPISRDSSISRKYAAVVTENGFIQVGYDAEQIQDDLSETIVNCTRFRRVGKTGYLILINADGEVICGGENLKGRSIAPLLESVSAAGSDGEGKVRTALLGEEKVYFLYGATEGYAVLSVIPASEAMENRNVVLFINSFMEILTFAVQFVLIYLLLKKVVINNIRSVNSSLARITSGDLEVTVDVRDNAEFASLSDDINSTVDTMKQLIAEAEARIDEELAFAKNIQISSLPGIFPPFPQRDEFDIYALIDTAKEVGGDFYDFYFLGEDRLCFLVADVSGKGIPAALFMMRAKTELKRLAETGAELNAVVEKANNDLCTGNEAGMFVTAWMCVLNLKTGELEFVNAGHNPPLVKHADGSFEYLRSRAGLVLGGMSDIPYRKMTIQLIPGDTLFLYTDGVTEATDSGNQLFGESRLQEALDCAEYKDMQELCGKVKQSVDSFVAEAPQFDDITMVALRYFGKQYPSMHFENAAIADIPTVTDFVENELEKLGCPMGATMRIAVAIDEIFSNIVNYAYEGETGPVTVTVQPRKGPQGVTLVFEDEGVPYNPLAKQDPDVTLPPEERGIGGLGILIVKKTMDDVSYEYKKGRNVLSLYKRF